VTPLELSTVYCPADLDHVDALSNGESSGFIYARDGHPNAAQLAEKLCRLEGERRDWFAPPAWGRSPRFSSPAQPRRSCLDLGCVYGKTASLATRICLAGGSHHDLFDPALDANALESLLKTTTRLIFAETISNPCCVSPIWVRWRRPRDTRYSVGRRQHFGPLISRPIEQGAGMVIHSVTKMIGGHSDLTLGALWRPNFIEQARSWPRPRPEPAIHSKSWLALRGFTTLSLRFTVPAKRRSNWPPLSVRPSGQPRVLSRSADTP